MQLMDYEYEEVQVTVFKIVDFLLLLLFGTFGDEIVHNVWCLFNDSYIMVLLIGCGISL